MQGGHRFTSGRFGNTTHQMAAFSIRTLKGGQSAVTVRIGPAVTMAKARSLQEHGWEVQITDSEGRVFDPDDFEARHREDLPGSS
jgi:hypothetical protein